MTKKLSVLIPTLTGLVVILAIIKLTLFYQNFSVPIKYFIGISEIAITISDDLLMLSLYYAVLKIFEILLLEHRYRFAFLFQSDITRSVYDILLYVLNIAALILFFFETEFYRKIVDVALIFFLLFLNFMKTKYVKRNFERNKDVVFILFYFAVTLFNVVLTTSNEIKSVMDGKYNGTKIVTDDTTYISSDSSYYIGQTNRFIFIYDKSKFCTVLPISSIKRLEIHAVKK
ncbi:MAG: hypothetical protein JST10_12565 [Bacteroidetes bacterium]|nr:hypothetical protein [Bacteroidota bacterium]MBS1633393.1 hypothetical protein [Bacteroidota bacterium]